MLLTRWVSVYLGYSGSTHTSMTTAPLPVSTAADDSSDDDEPLIKMVKKAPSEEQLKETVRRLLEDANLEEMTMKQICQRVRATPATD